MEGKVSDVRAAALVLEALMEKTIAERPQHRSQVVQLTEDEATGLFFAAQHLGDLVRALHDEIGPGLPQRRTDRERWPEAGRQRLSRRDS
jgi:hypothetical protein